MRRAWKFLLGLSSGEVKLDRVKPVREEARDILRHFPLGGDLSAAARSYAPKLLGKVEREATQYAHEAARESARADAAEKAPPVIEVQDYLNMP